MRSGAELARRHHVLIRRDRGATSAIDQVLPPTSDRLIDAQLAAQFGERNLLPQHASNLLSLELGAKEPPPI